MKDKRYCKVRNHCYYTGQYRGAAHSIRTLKYSVPKKVPIVFHNEYNYDYYFIIKELVEELKKFFTCLEKNTQKYITFTVLIEKEVTKIDKLQEIYLTYYSLLIAQDLWQVHYQILSMIFLKGLIELNVNSDTMTKI